MVETMIRLWVEFVALYLMLPASLLGVRLARGYTVPVLPVLWLAACPAAVWLVSRAGWGTRELIGFSMTRAQVRRLIVRLLAAAAVLSGGLLLVAPDQLLELPRRSPRLWALVMVCYPLLSVYPQGILYRGLFYARYACLFRGERMQLLAGAVVFSLAHLLFANGWALALTFAGGLLINRTYRKSGSLMVSDLEHSVYGQIVFTCGWGRFLYHGTTRFLAGLANAAAG